MLPRLVQRAAPGAPVRFQQFFDVAAGAVGFDGGAGVVAGGGPNAAFDLVGPVLDTRHPAVPPGVGPAAPVRGAAHDLARDALAPGVVAQVVDDVAQDLLVPGQNPPAAAAFAVRVELDPCLQAPARRPVVVGAADVPVLVPHVVRGARHAFPLGAAGVSGSSPLGGGGVFHL